MGVPLIQVTEFPGLATTDQGDSVSVMSILSSTGYMVSMTAGVGLGPFLQLTTKFIEICALHTCSFTLSSSAMTTATTSNKRIFPNERIIYGVSANPSIFQLSVITNT